MRVGIIGINHKSANLSLRELLAKACLTYFHENDPLHCEHAFILLSTCNRTEIYFSSNDLTATHSHFLKLLRSLVPQSFEHRLYSFFSYDCFTHLAMVSSGMDSAILAETEIQGQVKNAYELAIKERKIPHALHFLFQKCLKIGKDVRTRFNLGRGMPTLAEIVLKLALKQSDEIDQKKVLFVGASQVNAEIITAFENSKYPELYLCNRTLQRTEQFVIDRRVQAVPWSNLESWYTYDIIILGTKSSQYLIKEDCSHFLDKKLFLFDLSIPRNVAPEMGVHKCIQLYNIDELDQVLQQSRLFKEKEIFIVEKYILESVETQMAIFIRKNNHRHERQSVLIKTN